MREQYAIVSTQGFTVFFIRSKTEFHNSPRFSESLYSAFKNTKSEAILDHIEYLKSLIDARIQSFFHNSNPEFRYLNHDLEHAEKLTYVIKQLTKL